MDRKFCTTATTSLHMLYVVVEHAGCAAMVCGVHCCARTGVWSALLCPQWCVEFAALPAIVCGVRCSARNGVWHVLYVVVECAGCAAMVCGVRSM